MNGRDLFIGRRAGADGQPVGQQHAVMGASARNGGPLRAECGAQVDVVVGDWPPENAEEHACPVCYRDTAGPYA
jgi:hypothetical protein